VVRRHAFAIAALLLFLASLAIRWPGVAMYDSVRQYDQALSGVYSDWHPPIMARGWALLLPIWPGTAPFFLIQMALWWGGLGLLATVLAGTARRGAAGLILLCGAFPLFLGWQTVILKDAQMAACLTAAVALHAAWSLRGRSVPKGVWGLIALLVAYATLVRGNAAFATVPLVLALAHWGGVRRWWVRAGLIIAGIVAVLAISPILNHKAMGAEASHNDRALPLWDIVAITHRAHLTNPPGITPALWAEMEKRGCYAPYFWNPYGEEQQCGAIGDALAFDPDAGGQLMRDWVRTVSAHPMAYALHRAAHLNTTLRFLVGRGERDAIPPVDSEPNDLGLGKRASLPGRALVWLAAMTSETPLGWPACWLAAGAALLWALGRADTAEARLARALILSALVMSGSFAVASIASDLRYHLWSMIAVALALVIGWTSAEPSRRKAAGAITLVVALVATAAHLFAAPVYVPLPPPKILAH